MANLPRTIPNPGPVNPGRPGFVMIAGFLSSLTGASPLRLTEVLPGVSAAASGLAAGAMITAVLGRPRWEGAAVAIGVGASAFAVHVIDPEGYQDGAIAAAVYLGAATAVLLSLRDRRVLLPAVFLLGAVGVVHWSFFPVAAAVVVLAALLHVPSSFRAWRGGRPLPDTAAGRMFQGVAGGAALAAVAILGLLSAPLPSARLVGEQLLDKLKRDLPGYRVPVTLVAAAAGAVSLSGPTQDVAGDDGEPGPTGSFLRLMLAWCEVALLAFVAEWVLGWAVPAHRVLAFTLALPVLGTLGLIWVARAAGRAWKPLTALVVVAGLGLSAALAQRDWLSFHPVMRPALLDQAAAAGRYLTDAGIPANQPVVFVMDDRGVYAWSAVWLASHTIRAELPAPRIARTYFYVGTPDDYVARRPTTIPLRTATAPGTATAEIYDGLATSYFVAMRGTYRQAPVALILEAVNPAYGAWVAGHPSLVVGPGVALVAGSLPLRERPAGVAAPGASPPGAGALIGLALAALALLAVAGAGWTAAMFPGLEPAEVAALTPAVGAAVLVVGGALLNVAGVPLRGWGAAAIPVLLGAAGWVAARRRARTTDG